jgi:hypothetical protein
VSGSIEGGTSAGLATSRTLASGFTFSAVLAATGTPFPWWLLLAGCAAIVLGLLAAGRSRLSSRATASRD